jgi:site-specific DNA-cytosine methylase
MRRIFWDLFTGIGGAATGAKLAGLIPALGVECDPKDRKLSEAFINIHQMNGHRGTKLMTVQDFVMWGCPDMPLNAHLAHISPVCADFSAASNGGVNHANMSMAIACVMAIEAGMPLNFTLEQVPMYRFSPEFEYIKARAIELGYTFNQTVLNIGAQSGQSRKRLVVTASRIGNWESPLQQPIANWYSLIEDLIPAFDPIKPTDRQRASAALWYSKHPDDRDSPLYVERVTSGTDPKSRGTNEVIPTLTKSKFRDGSQNGRSKVTCLYLPEGDRWLNLTLEAYAALAGFPDSFKYPNDYNTVGSGFGYSVPPGWYATLAATAPQN